MKINSAEAARRLVFQQQQQQTQRIPAQQSGLGARPVPFHPRPQFSSNPYAGFETDAPPALYGGTPPPGSNIGGFAPSFGAAPLSTFGGVSQPDVQRAMDTIKTFGDHMTKINDVLKSITDTQQRAGFSRSNSFGSAWDDDTQFPSPSSFGSRNRRSRYSDDDDAAPSWADRFTGAFGNPSNLMGLAFAGAALRPIAGAMNAYQDSVANQAGMLGQMGVSGSDLMSGQFGSMMRVNAQQEQARLGLSQSAFMAYGGLMGAMNGPGGAIGVGAALAGPALMAGQMAGALVPGLGMPIAAGMAAYGAINYASAASTDWTSQSRVQNVMGQAWGGSSSGIPLDAALGQVFTDFGGSVGVSVNKFKYDVLGIQDADREKFDNSPLFGNVASQFASGQLTRQQAEQQLAGTGFGTKHLSGFAMDDYLKNQANAGISEQPALSALSFWNRVNPSRFPTPAETNLTNDLYYRGVNPSQINPFMSAVAASQGQNALDPSVLSQTAASLLPAISQQANPQQYMERGSALSNFFEPINQQRSLAGMGRIDALQFMGSPLESNLDMQAALANEQGQMIQSRMRDSSWHNTFGSELYAAAEAGIYSGNFEGAQRAMTRGNRVAGLYDRYAGYGASPGQLRAGLAPMFGLSGDQYNMVEGAAQGDGFAIGALGRATGDASLMQADPIFQRNFAFNHQMQQQRTQFALMTGGAAPNQWNMGVTSLDAQGRAVGGDGLQYLGSAFQSANLPFQSGNGMGLWQIQDAQTAAQRNMQQFGFGQQARSLSISESQYNLSGTQFYENWGLQQRQQQSSAAFGRASLDLSRQGTLLQQQYRSEDLEYSENQSQMQFGWAMQDADRAIRFSRGRERLDLLRQKDRAVIQQSMQQGRFDVQEGRNEQQSDLENKRYEIDKERLENTIDMAKESAELSRRHFEQNREYDRERMEMARQAFEKQKAYSTELYGLEDQNRLLTRQAAILQNETSMEYQQTVHATATVVAGLTSNVELLGAAALRFQQHVERAVEPSANGSASGLGSDVANILQNILSQVTKSASQPNISANIQMNEHDAGRISVRDLASAAYTSTGNSRAPGRR